MGAVLALSASGLYYSRLYYVEPVVGLLALLGVRGALAALRAAGRAPIRLAAAAGLAFGVRGDVPLRERPRDGGDERGCGVGAVARGPRWRAVGAPRCSPRPPLPIAAVLAMNWHRFGSPLVTGYTYYDADQINIMTASSLPRNLRGLATVLAGVPWLGCAVAALIVARRSPRCAWRRGAAVVLAALAAQECMWQAFKCMYWSPLRYHVAIIMLAGVGLPPLAVALARRWPRRGLTYATLVAMIASVICLFATQDFCRPLQNDPEDPVNPGQVTVVTWYARSGPYHFQEGYTFSIDGRDETSYYPRVPLGWREALIMGALISVGGVLLRRAWLQAGRADAQAGTPPAPAAA